jgi:type VI secretion system Hcp family effector
MKPFFVLLTALFILHTITNGQTITMTVESNTQGKFKSEIASQNDKIAVTAASLEIASPTTGAGMAAGRRQHQPFMVKKTAGAASPQFMQAMITNELLKRVILEFRGTNEYGEEGVTYKITLENVRVSSFKQATEIVEGGKAPKSVLMDDIRLIYQKITVESSSGQTISTDDTGMQLR